jgi:neurobeachin
MLTIFVFSIILQMSVWQDYLLSLAYVYPSNEQQTDITDRVFELLKILLHHAIKFEFGGWRVWIDTLSILHGRVNLPWNVLPFKS